MSAARALRRSLLAAALLVVAGCATVPPRMTTSHMAALVRREQALEDVTRWSLTGRLAVSDGRDGGSGRFDWTQDGDDYVIEIRAPVSQETWRLTGDARGCRLEGARDEPLVGTDPEELLARELGWRLPVREMRAWVRGIAHDPRGVILALDDEGRPRRLQEARWTIDFMTWDDAETPAMPKRIFAERPPYKVRLAIADWSLERGR